MEEWFLGTDGNTLVNIGLSFFANFSAAPETIKSSINPQKKAKYAISGMIKSSKLFLHVGNNPSDF